MIENSTPLDIIRLLVGIVILSYASYTDMKTRRASNMLWVIMGILGVVLLLIQYLLLGIDNLFELLFIPIMIGLMYLFFQLRLLFGGADAKALMALAILVPVRPMINGFPMLTSVFPASWVIFMNSIIIFLVIPLALFVYNLVKRDIRFPHCFIGYTMSIEKAKERFVWPLEKIVDGKRKLVYMPKEFDVEEEILELEKHGASDIWVTPKVPFMIPLLAGFITSFIIGDFLVTGMNALLSAII